MNDYGELYKKQYKNEKGKYQLLLMLQLIISVL
jgi:hypothetical protein